MVVMPWHMSASYLPKDKCMANAFRCIQDYSIRIKSPKKFTEILIIFSSFQLDIDVQLSLIIRNICCKIIVLIFAIFKLN